jgi:transposase, IS5 family
LGKELQVHGIAVNTDTIVGAAAVGTPSSSKNTDKAHAPDMHQTRKDQQWYFGMKLLSAWTAKRAWRTTRW